MSGIVDKVGTGSITDISKVITANLNTVGTLGTFGVINSSVAAFPDTTIPPNNNNNANGTQVQTNTNTNTDVGNQGPNLLAIILPSVLGGLLALLIAGLLTCYCCKLCCWKEKPVGVDNRLDT